MEIFKKIWEKRKPLIYVISAVVLSLILWDLGQVIKTRIEIKRHLELVEEKREKVEEEKQNLDSATEESEKDLNNLGEKVVEIKVKKKYNDDSAKVFFPKIKERGKE